MAFSSEDDSSVYVDGRQPAIGLNRSAVVRCAFSDFGAMQHAIEGRGLTPIGSQSEYVAANLTELPEAKLDEVMELVAAFEGDDDVQNVYTNLA